MKNYQNCLEAKCLLLLFIIVIFYSCTVQKVSVSQNNNKLNEIETDSGSIENKTIILKRALGENRVRNYFRGRNSNVIRGKNKNVIAFEKFYSGKSEITLKSGEVVVTEPYRNTKISGDGKAIVKYGNIPYREYSSNSDIIFYNNGNKVKKYDTIKCFRFYDISYDGYVLGLTCKDFRANISIYKPNGEELISIPVDSNIYIKDGIISKGGSFVALDVFKDKKDDFSFLRIYDSQGNLLYKNEESDLQELYFSELGNYLLIDQNSQTLLYDIKDKSIKHNFPQLFNIPSSNMIDEVQNIIYTVKLSSPDRAPNLHFKTTIIATDILTGKKIGELKLPGIHSFQHSGTGFIISKKGEIRFATDNRTYSIKVKNF